MKNDCLDAALAVLDEAGVRDFEIARGAKHPQARFRVNGNPALHIFAFPGSTSDHRSPQNTRRGLRKVLRELGVSVAPERDPTSQPARQPSQLELALREIEALKQRMLAVESRIGGCAAK